MQYLIDGNAVNARTDFTHDVVPGPPQSRRVEQFPGIAELTVNKGPVLPPKIVVTGFLEAEGETIAECVDLLHAQILTENSRRENTSLFTITVHDEEFEDCELANFEVAGQWRPVQVADGVKLTRAVRWTWQQLRRANA